MQYNKINIIEISQWQERIIMTNWTKMVCAMHVYLPPTKVRLGFTLAEVLITLGIIGIVAAMTIPTLMQKYYEKQTVAHLKETY